MPTKASPTAASASSRPTGALRAAMSRTTWKEISTSTPIMCIALPSNLAGEATSAPASSGAGLGSAVGVRAPTFQPATGPDRARHLVLDGIDRTAVRQGEGRRHLDARTPGLEERPHRV